MDTHFTNQIQPLNPAQRASTSQPNSSFQPEMNSRDQNDQCSGSYSQISNPAPQNLTTGQAPLFEIPQEVNQQLRNVHGSCRDINHYSLLRKFNYIRQHNCYLENLVKTKSTELNVFRENERHLKTQLGSLQQTNVSQVQEIQSLRLEEQNLKNTTVSKHQYDEIFAQNQIIGANNIKLCDDNDELVKETTQVRLEKAELLIQNEKLQQDHGEANQNLKNEETKRIKVEKELKDLKVTQAPSVVMLNEFKESVETCKVKISTLEKELTSLKEGNKSQVEQLEDELGGANAQIVQLNSQLQSSSEQFNFISDQSRELSANVEQLNLENKILKRNVAGLDKEKWEKDKLFIENGKLQQDLEEANKKLKNEENKRIEVETKCMNLTNIQLQLEENIKNSEKRVENHQEKVKSLEAELTNLKESNNSHVEKLNNELDRAKAQIIHLNFQFNELSKEFKLSSDQNHKLSAKVKQLNADNKRRKTYVEGLEEENSELQKFKDDTTSQTANELVSECEHLKEELENEKKRSSELNETVQKQSEEFKELNARYDDDKNELQRKSNMFSALEKLLEKVNDELQQEKTVVSRQKRQIEELELRINEAQENNEEVSMIIESQDEENYAKTIVINQHKVLIASLKTQIVQLKQNVKEKKMELDKEEEKNLKKQTEMDNLRKILKEMDSEIMQHDYIVQQLQTEIKQRDDEIRTEKTANERLLGEKAELEAKLQSEVSARNSSMVIEHQSCLSQNLSQEKLGVPEQRGHKPDHSEIADDNDSLRKRL